ncbi:MAG: hypothetical protein ABL993_06775 [Vicinamibacterales bacterium]
MELEFTLTIDTKGEAFGPDPSLELAWILRKLADHILRGLNPSVPYSSDLHDVRGNKVGEASWTPASKEGEQDK